MRNRIDASPSSAVYSTARKTTEESEAKRLKAIVEDTLQLLKRGVLPLHQNPSVDELFRFLLSGGKQAAPREVRQDILLGELCRVYGESHSEDEKDASTLKTEIIHQDHLKRLLGAKSPLSVISIERITEYVRTRRSEKGIRGRTVQPTTVTNELQTFSQLWAFGVDRKLVPGRMPYRQD